MAGLTAGDVEFIRDLRERGVLEDVDPHRLDQREGVIGVVCSDGDQMFDFFGHLSRMQESHRPGTYPRIHLIAHPGGALRLVRGAPANRPGSTFDDDMMDGIYRAYRSKNIGIVTLQAHAPCTHCGDCGISVRQAFDLLLRAKERVRLAIPKLTRAAFFQVDDGGRREHYFVVRERLEPFLAERL